MFLIRSYIHYLFQHFSIGSRWFWSWRLLARRLSWWRRVAPHHLYSKTSPPASDRRGPQTSALAPRKCPPCPLPIGAAKIFREGSSLLRCGCFPRLRFVVALFCESDLPRMDCCRPNRPHPGWPVEDQQNLKHTYITARPNGRLTTIRDQDDAHVLSGTLKVPVS